MERVDSSPHPPIHNLVRWVTQRDVVMDANLPMWARRSNPIVRRELGFYWKRIFPNVGLIVRALIAQSLILLIVPPFFLMNLLYPMAVVGFLLIPLLMFLYGRVLIVSLLSAASAMSTAHANHTIDLLRVSLIPLRHIVLGKASASLWRRMEDLDLVMMISTAMALTLTLFSHFANIRPDDIDWTLRLLSIVTMWVLPLRLMLEPFMLAVLGVAFGTAFHMRSTAVTATFSASLFYYVLMLLPFSFGLTLMWRVVFQVVLPVIIPLVVIVLATAFAEHSIENKL